jgi:hypothetical protein
MISEIELKRIVLKSQIKDFELFVKKYNPNLVLELGDNGLPNIETAAKMNDQFKEWLDKYPIDYPDNDRVNMDAFDKVNILNLIRQKKFRNIIRAHDELSELRVMEDLIENYNGDISLAIFDKYNMIRKYGGELISYLKAHRENFPNEPKVFEIPIDDPTIDNDNAIRNYVSEIDLQYKDFSKWIKDTCGRKIKLRKAAEIILNDAREILVTKIYKLQGEIRELKQLEIIW